ncbi:MAG: thiamine-phosphate kinase [Gammaproteobacteria bacterium]|nr:thiamine-phosphate kinase [Gammaproteobacteria bacterium]MDH4311841.1 thiamine-phosphate kinase [Gammaproteobacteria bacterium]MDH5271677.1 thiamine-phosphate kinase [Gammaproteobacteria bacterium]
MPLGEFDVIARYFSRSSPRSDVLLGVGDDAALLAPPPGQALVAATDTLVEGRHFLPGTPANAIGHQALAVNLSDLAAMGAEPAWALLSLSMPRPEERWLADFADGLYALAERHGVALVGGDTVSGPLVITIEVLGFVPPAAALLRSGARAGDLIVVSGAPGVAAAGLEELESGRATFESRDARVRRFLRAEPRLALGHALRGLATAAMDVSDGLLGDLGKLARSSGLGACIDLERLPVAPELAAYPAAEQERLVLHGGDDYELLFTLPADRFGHIPGLAAAGGCSLQCIGSMVQGEGVECRRNGARVNAAGKGYDHFAT